LCRGYHSFCDCWDSFNVTSITAVSCCGCRRDRDLCWDLCRRRCDDSLSDGFGLGRLFRLNWGTVACTTASYNNRNTVTRVTTLVCNNRRLCSWGFCRGLGRGSFCDRRAGNNSFGDSFRLSWFFGLNRGTVNSSTIGDCDRSTIAKVTTWGHNRRL
jgi:hypothetical protein